MFIHVNVTLKVEKKNKFSFCTLFFPRKKIHIRYFRCLKCLISYNMCKTHRQILLLKNIQKFKKLCKISLRAIIFKNQTGLRGGFEFLDNFQNIGSF